MARFAPLPMTLLALASLSACAPTGSDGGAQDFAGRAAFTPSYNGIRTVLLDGDLVNFHVSMRGARDQADVEDYARCAAAQYALIRGAGFTRLVRSSVTQTGGNSRGDAVYTISKHLPRGSATIDAEITVRDCGARGIPTI